MADDVSVLFFNDAFYTAFFTRDVAAMIDAWSRREGITCVHPGWAPLSGRDAVINSWRAILGNPDAPKIACNHARATVLGDVAYVICYEHFGRSTFLVATNIFVRENGTWKMLHHQAGVAPAPEEDDDDDRTRLQ